MFTFYDNYAEIDEYCGEIKKITHISTHQDRIAYNNVFIKYFGAELLSTIIKSYKIKSLKDDGYRVFNVFCNIHMGSQNFEKKILFNTDEMPMYFYKYFCQNLFIDIKEDDYNDYVIEIECIPHHNSYFNAFLDDVIKLSKKGFQYILKDKVIVVNFNDEHYGMYDILTIDEYLKSGKPLISSFVPKIKSNSKSANKR